MTLPAAALRTALSFASVLLALSGYSVFHRQTEQNCMERAMHFESNRSSRDGLIAVGSVVMHRAQSRRYPDNVCEVVGQKRQFAPGVLSRKMPANADVQEAANSVLRGERHPLIGNAMFFHTAGHSFPYDNMHYVLVTGGNAFYEKRGSSAVTQPVPPQPTEGITGS